MTDEADPTTGHRAGGDRGEPDGANRPWYRGIGRVAAVLFVLATALWWIWALSPLAPRGNADRLEGRAFPERAEQICAETTEEIARLRPAPEVETPAERAEDVAAGTALTVEMVDRLDAISDVDGEDQRLVDLWLADWRRYIEDRRAYEERLRADASDDDLRFLVSAVEDIPVDERIDNFARVNDMDACEVPGDV